jgi:sigma-B regulation protein RsbU (phosphoserine phosphatase)
MNGFPQPGANSFRNVPSILSELSNQLFRADMNSNGSWIPGAVSSRLKGSDATAEQRSALVTERADVDAPQPGYLQSSPAIRPLGRVVSPVPDCTRPTTAWPADAARLGLMFFLQANNGPQAGKRYELKGEKYILGRHPDCQIVIEVGAVSRNHCQIVRSGEQYLLEDLGSRNGTYVNDDPQPLAKDEKRPLRAGDQLRVCEVSFTFLVDRLSSGPATTGSIPKMVEGAGLGAFLADDENQTPGSTIMSKLDVSSSSRGGLHVSASAEVKLAALVEITQNLGRALALDEVLPQVLKSLFKIFVQADRGFIVLQLPDGKLVPRWVRLRREDANDTLRISRTIIRHVMETKEAILSADAASDERFEMSQSIADFRIRSMMCAPLMNNEGQAFGALQIDTLDQRQRFTKEDLEILVSTASQASIAIQNAQLHEAALKQRELQRDMQLAHEVQHGFLPDRHPEIPGYEFFDYYQPADQIGGDYYDYIPIPDGRVAVVVADVVGHGVAAALLMAKLSAETRFSLFSEPNAAAAITRLNERIAALNIQRFITLIMVVLDPANHTATIVNAGHMAPLHRRASGKIEEPGETIAGLPLGITDALGYEQCEVKIEPGDVLALYTDGVNESIDVAGAFYTIDRLRDHLRKLPAQPQKIGETIIEDVRKFLGKAPQNDDMCFVCFGRTKK